MLLNVFLLLVSSGFSVSNSCQNLFEPPSHLVKPFTRTIETERYYLMPANETLLWQISQKIVSRAVDLAVQGSNNENLIYGIVRTLDTSVLAQYVAERAAAVVHFTPGSSSRVLHIEQISGIPINYLVTLSRLSYENLLLHVDDKGIPPDRSFLSPTYRVTYGSLKVVPRLFTDVQLSAAYVFDFVSQMKAKLGTEGGYKKPEYYQAFARQLAYSFLLEKIFLERVQPLERNITEYVGEVVKRLRNPRLHLDSNYLLDTPIANFQELLQVMDENVNFPRYQTAKEAALAILKVYLARMPFPEAISPEAEMPALYFNNETRFGSSGRKSYLLFEIPIHFQVDRSGSVHLFFKPDTYLQFIFLSPSADLDSDEARAEMGQTIGRLEDIISGLKSSRSRLH
jgi:hypothetical protein